MSFTRPDIFLDDNELALWADQATDALIAWVDFHGRDAPLAARGPQFVARSDGDDVLEVNSTRLRDFLAQAARFSVITTQGQQNYKLPPRELTDVLIERGAASRGASGDALPRVSCVTDVPILAADGSLVTEPGLHNDSGIWFLPAHELSEIASYVEDVSHVDNVQWARDLLLEEVLGEFDFADDASRAHALALMLLPFVREYIGPNPTPLHAVLAPQQGTGKTTLVNVCLVPGLGDASSMDAEPRDEEELRKKITATLVGGERLLFFDNLNNELASGVLAAALTSLQWKDRILGHSVVTRLENKLIWVATANNLGSSAELADRVCPIWLEPHKGVTARERARHRGSFRHEEVVSWAITKRPELVGACLTLILNWTSGRAEMSPDGKLVRTEDRAMGPLMGSFPRWSNTLGGILAAAQVPGFLENRDKLQTVDLDTLEISVFFEQLATWSHGEEFQMRDLMTAVQFGAPLHDVLPYSVGKPEAGRLGRWLHKHKDATYGDWMLRARQARGRTTVYRLTRRGGVDQ